MRDNICSARGGDISDRLVGEAQYVIAITCTLGMLHGSSFC